jgi:nitrogen fixation/metabolism regulation signal transduction histidine kinase
VSLRGRLLAYLIVLHVALAALLGTLAWSRRAWLIPAEAALLASLAVGSVLLRRMFAADRFPDDAARLLEDGDFTSRLREVGEPSLDRLVRIYNQMADRLRGERVRLQEQHYFLGELLAASPAGIVALDYDGRITSANPAAVRLFGRGPSGLEGRRVAELDGPLGDALAALGPGGTAVAVLGGGRRVRCRAGRFLDTGFPRSFYVLEELTEELRQAEKAAYEKLIRVVSHEVNNTVGAAGSLLDSCLRYAPQIGEHDRADYEGALGVVIARAEQLNRFVRAFADVVRLPEPRREACDVVAIVSDVARLLGPECEQRGIGWKWETATPIAAAVDRAQMAQALLNVCRNAVDAIDGQGTITVRTGRAGGVSTLTIEDTGPGISAEARPHLFTPFFTTKPHGQGIGLTLSHEILNRHGLGHDLAGPPPGPTRFTIRFE